MRFFSFFFCLRFFSFFVFFFSLHSGRPKERHGRSRHRPTKVFEFVKLILRPRRSQKIRDPWKNRMHFHPLQHMRSFEERDDHRDDMWYNAFCQIGALAARQDAQASPATRDFRGAGKVAHKCPGAWRTRPASSPDPTRRGFARTTTSQTTLNTEHRTPNTISCFVDNILTTSAAHVDLFTNHASTDHPQDWREQAPREG